MENLHFTVDSALLSELGEKLVETVHLALVELVKNSYDADATEVKAIFTKGPEGKSQIQVIDNGTGMNFQEVENYWMRIATTDKAEKNVSTIYGRPRTGSKGIGRFCCRRLGRELQLVTVGRKNGQYQKTEVIFPWNNFKPGTDVTEIDCPGGQSVLAGGPTGTTLKINDLVDEWNTRGYEYLKRQLAVLVANRGTRRKGYLEDPGFNIILEAPQFEGGLRNLREDLINAGWGTLTAYVNKEHQAVCELHALGIGRKTIVSKEEYLHLRNIKLKIGILVDDRNQLRDKRVLSLGALRKILHDWGGVQIKYKGFRVYPYGDDDWLDIDRDRGLRKTKPKDELYSFAESLKGIDPSRSLLNMLSMRSYVGEVVIGINAPGFEMKASREGFIKSEAMDELKPFARFAVDWATIWREYYLRTQAKKTTEIARAYLEEVLKEDVAPEKIVEAAVTYIQREVKNISSLLPSKNKRHLERSLGLATDAIIKHEQSNREELRHLRLIASTSTLLLIFSHEVRSLLGMLESNQSALAVIEKNLSGKDRNVVKETRAGLSEAKNRFNQLLDMTSLIAIDSRTAVPNNLALRERVEKAVEAFRLIVSSYEIDIDPKQIPTNIAVKSMLEAELYAILLNVLSNSIKSVIAAGGEKKIRITADREDRRTVIRIMDTGIGLDPSKFEEVFVPFIADPEGKLYRLLAKKMNPQDKYIVGTGSGLGLSIVKEIVHVHSGTIAFLKPKGNWKAELEIKLP
jgi:signal transduction histidine kinase